jgi:AcrR family transcriptional regulator
VFTINIVDNPVTYSSSTPIRVEPVQARSAARVGALLDAACHVMHDVGYEPLTTAMVAERAGASIGTVYRYFPDRVAVLQAVAARNLERVTSALRADLNHHQPSTIAGALATALETLTRFFREEQGFRSLRVGDVLDIRPLTGSRGGNAEIAAVIKDYLHDTHNLRLDSAGRLAIETAIDVIDALLGRAFMHSDRGESTVLSEAKRVSQCIAQDISA